MTQDLHADVMETEDFAALVEARLEQLASSPQGDPWSVAFPAALSAAQRRHVHQVAQHLGLLSASAGEGSCRRLTVYRPGAQGAPAPGAAPAAADGAPREERLSRMLASLLRHRGLGAGLDIGGDGYARLTSVVALPGVKAAGFSAAEVEELVAEKDEKHRFHICARDGEKWIRANQGHTLRTVQDSKLLEPITDPDELACCVHGTYLLAWDEIVNHGGLSRMARNHIHFAPRPPGEGEVISGMRNDAEVAVFVSMASAAAAGIQFFRSSNDVILTRGDPNGMVPLRHFERAVRLKDGALLWPPPTLATAAPLISAAPGPREVPETADRPTRGGGIAGPGHRGCSGGSASDCDSGEEEIVVLGHALLMDST